MTAFLESAGARHGAGLQAGYAAMIKAAFQPKWWQSRQIICIAADGNGKSLIPQSGRHARQGAKPYFQMEYNFSLFWGIAIQLYESTLVANQTPLDQYLSQQQTYVLNGDSLQEFLHHPAARRR